MFSRISLAWTEVQKLKASDAALNDNFALSSVSMCGTAIIVGADGDDDIMDDSGTSGSETPYFFFAF